MEDVYNLYLKQNEEGGDNVVITVDEAKEDTQTSTKKPDWIQELRMAWSNEIENNMPAEKKRYFKQFPLFDDDENTPTAEETIMPFGDEVSNNKNQQQQAQMGTSYVFSKKTRLSTSMNARRSPPRRPIPSLRKSQSDTRRRTMSFIERIFNTSPQTSRNEHWKEELHDYLNKLDNFLNESKLVINELRYNKKNLEKSIETEMLHLKKW